MPTPPASTSAYAPSAPPPCATCPPSTCHPKLYFFDPGVAGALKRQLGPTGAEERGPLLEGFVYTLLRFYRERSKLCDHIAYWAPTEARATEVDFVLSRGKERLAIEVKATRVVRPDDLRGLRAARELDGLVRRVLVFLGARPQVTSDDIHVLPFDDFTAALAAGSLWP